MALNSLEVSFEFDGFEFYVYKSKGNSEDPNWYLWSPTFNASDDKIGIVPSPFEDYNKFEEKAISLCKDFIEEWYSERGN